MNPYREQNPSFPVVRFLIGWLLHGYFGLKTYGLANIPDTGPFVVASNHASNLDPILLGFTIVKRQIGFLAKEELFHVPLLKSVIPLWGAFPVKRGSRDSGAIETFLETLSHGKPLLLFPEGTRTLDGELQPAKTGVGRLLYGAKVPVIPAYVAGTFECFRKGSRFPRPGRTSVSYGQPVPLEGLYREKPEKTTFTMIGSLVMEHIAKLKPRVS